MASKCFDCKQDILEPITWLGEDYREKGRVVYSFHHDCSLGAWPLFPLSEEEARAWIADGAFTNGPHDELAALPSSPVEKV